MIRDWGGMEGLNKKVGSPPGSCHACACTHLDPLCAPCPAEPGQQRDRAMQMLALFDRLKRGLGEAAGSQVGPGTWWGRCTQLLGCAQGRPSALRWCDRSRMRAS